MYNMKIRYTYNVQVVYDRATISCGQCRKLA